MHYEIAPYSDDSYSNYKAAIEDFNQALRLNPQDAETYVKRGIVRSEMALYSGDSYSNYRTAIEDFNQALRLNPQNAEAYIKRVLFAMKLHHIAATLMASIGSG
jgi:tetratricopeptide (TPR) repeat protein